MKTLLTSLCLLVVQTSLISQVKLHGQWQSGDTSQVQILKTRRGDRFIGRLLSINKTAAVFLLSSHDTIVWPKKEIIRIEALKSSLLPPKFARQRLFFAPTAFTLEKGISEYRNNSWVLNSYRKGFTDKFQMGVGFMPALVVNLVWTDFKYTIPLSKNLRAGVGGIAGGGIDFQYYDDSQMLGFAAGLGILTIGSEYNFINLAMARFLKGNEGPNDDGHSKYWGFSMGGAFKAKRKSDRFFIELTVFPEDNRFYSTWAGGIGYTYEKKRSLDIAIRVVPFGLGSRYPMIGITSRRKK
jgi:hypothetical protein